MIERLNGLSQRLADVDWSSYRKAIAELEEASGNQTLDPIRQEHLTTLAKLRQTGSQLNEQQTRLQERIMRRLDRGCPVESGPWCVQITRSTGRGRSGTEYTFRGLKLDYRANRNEPLNPPRSPDTLPSCRCGSG